MANHLKREKKLAVVNLLVEGCSIRSTERITGVHRDTIMRLLLKVGEHCEGIMADQMRDIESDELQIDEVWSFVGKKQGHVKPGDSPEYGDAYTFIGMDAVSKLVIHHLTGKRDESTTRVFMHELSERVAGHTHIAVDGFGPYPAAIRESFRNRADAMAIVKTYRSKQGPEHRYSPPTVVGCRRYSIQGFPRRSRSSTSHVERLNWTCRTFIKRLNRLTAGFSKRLPNLRAAIAMTLCWYNFVKIHRSLGVTPAMAAHVTSRIWSIDDLVPAN